MKTGIYKSIEIKTFWIPAFAGMTKNSISQQSLYHLMLITGLRLSEALSLNIEHAGRAKIEVKVKRWTKNRPEGRGLASNS